MKELIITRIDNSESPNQEYRDLTPHEIAKVENVRIVNAVQDSAFRKKRALGKELNKKGWNNITDFMTEIFDKGFDTMKQEFDSIKSEVDSRFQ